MKSVVLVALLVACVDPPPTPIAGESHVFTFDHPAYLPRKVDVLFAIDDSPALAPYIDRIRALPPPLLETVSWPYGLPSLRVGVVTPSRGLTDYLFDTQNVDGTRTQNFDGTIDDAIRTRLDVGAASDAQPQLFEAVHAALPGFVRPNGTLLIVTISARDDASPGEPLDYAAYASSLESGFGSTYAAGIYTTGSPRMDAFHSALHSQTTSIDAADYADAFMFRRASPFTFASPCIPEPALPHDCAITVTDEDGTEHLLAMPDYEIKADPINCYAPDSHRVHVRGYADPYRPAMRGQCVAR